MIDEPFVDKNLQDYIWNNLREDPNKTSIQLYIMAKMQEMDLAPRYFVRDDKYPYPRKVLGLKYTADPLQEEVIKVWLHPRHVYFHTDELDRPFMYVPGLPECVTVKHNDIIVLSEAEGLWSMNEEQFNRVYHLSRG